MVKLIFLGCSVTLPAGSSLVHNVGIGEEEGWLVASYSELPLLMLEACRTWDGMEVYCEGACALYSLPIVVVGKGPALPTCAASATEILLECRGVGVSSLLCTACGLNSMFGVQKWRENRACGIPASLGLSELFLLGCFQEIHLRP